MTARFFDGGWYVDALPDGRFVVVYADGRIETSDGPLSAPPGGSVLPLFPRLNPGAAGLEFAGQAWQVDGLLTYTQGGWQLQSSVVPCGVSPVIYDWTGTLHVSDCSIGSQGWRYVTPENVLVTGDETYGPSAGAPGLYEWTDLGGLVVGQGADNGILVWDGTVHRCLIAPPNFCRFIRAWRVGDDVSIAWWGETGVASGFVLTTMDALRALPVYEPPIEVPTMRPIPTDVQQTIDEYVAIYPVPRGDGSEAWIEDEVRYGWTKRLQETIRSRHGAAWGAKSTSDGSPRGKDTIAFNGPDGLEVWDILVGTATGNPTLAVEDAEYHFVPDQYFIPSDPLDHVEFPPKGYTARPPVPNIVGHTAFDWHLHRDPAWLDVWSQTTMRWLRLVVASQQPAPRIAATLEEGRQALRLALPILRQRGMRALVSVNCDTALHVSPTTGQVGLTKQDVLDHTAAVSAILEEFADVAVPDGGNEGTHGVEQGFMACPYFLQSLDFTVPASLPYAWPAAHGGEPATARTTGGSWVAHHADRIKTPEVNGAYMAQVAHDTSKVVVDRESLGYGEEDQPGRRTTDPEIARRQAQAALDYDLGIILHTEAGLTARVAALGPHQRACIAEADAVLRGSVEPPIEPPTGSHPILDAPLSPAYPTGYQFFVHHWREILDEADAWFRRHRAALGIVPVAPDDPDLGHGLWRGLNEGDRWGTLRRAWQETWPGGQP